MNRVAIIDSHTGGEPTRIVLNGGPDLGDGSVADKLACFRQNHDRFRSAVVNEPRGSDVVVGASLVPSKEPGCVTGVIFFNNVGYLGMCGHGTIGLIASLAHLGRIGPGEHRIETPVGIVYETDAKIEPKVKMIGVFPENSYPPVTYPIAATASTANPGVPRYLDFLRTTAAKSIFEKYGFSFLIRPVS